MPGNEKPREALGFAGFGEFRFYRSFEIAEVAFAFIFIKWNDRN
jgi:hypothetical protein